MFPSLFFSGQWLILSVCPEKFALFTIFWRGVPNVLDQVSKPGFLGWSKMPKAQKWTFFDEIFLVCPSDLVLWVGRGVGHFHPPPEGLGFGVCYGTVPWHQSRRSPLKLASLKKICLGWQAPGSQTCPYRTDPWGTPLCKTPPPPVWVGKMKPGAHPGVSLLQWALFSRRHPFRRLKFQGGEQTLIF